MRHIPLRSYWSLFAVYLRPHARQVALLAVLLLASLALQLLQPQLLRHFIDAARSGAPTASLIRVALLFLGVALVQQLAALGTTYVGENLGWKTTNQLRLDLTRHCLHLDLAFHNARSPGELIERVDGDVKLLANFFSQLVVQVLGSGLLVVGILGLLFWEDWRVGVTLTTVLLVAFAVLARMRGIVVPFWTASRQAIAEMYGLL